MKTKILKVSIVTVLLFTLCAIPTFASGYTGYTKDEGYELASKLVTVPEVLYSADSTVSEGITLEPYVDDFTQTVGVKIIPDLPFGHVIYDDPSTDIIDGIRVNGETVKSYYYAIHPDTILSDDFSCSVVVKTVYQDDTAGKIAQIIDGKFSAEMLFTNPVLTMQLVYYALSAILVIVSIITILRNKKKRVKTADEITNTINVKTEMLEARVKELVNESLKSDILPVFQANANSTQNVVKALALANSKDRNAPLAILDLLENVSSKDSASLIEDAKRSVQKELAVADAHKETVIETLKNIAETSQEDLANVVEEKSVF